MLPLVLPAVLALGLSSCGDEEGGSGGSGADGDALSQIEVTGEPGTAPKVDFGGELSVDDLTSDVLVEGDGETIASGDSVLAHIWVGNGFSQEKAFSTHDNGAAELLTADDKTLSEVFLTGIENQTVGSRVAVAAPASEAFGETGNPQLGIGNKDTVLVVVDLMSPVADGPEGDASKGPSWAPEVVEEDGTPTGFDFAGTPKPNGELRSAVLVQGEGATVEKGQTIAVDYIGQVFEGKKPFDESYSSGNPVGFGIGTGAVIPGWDKTLVGEKVGSRVILSIPPEQGYGAEGNPNAGIKGTDTLYFLIDILAAG